MKYDELPNITTQRVCIFVGAHVEMDDKLERAISEFCKKYNGIVLCDHTSNYRGEYRAFCNIVANQYYWKSTIQNVELMVHIGDISSSDYKIQAKEVWRVNPDGEIRDTFQKLYNVFEMKETSVYKGYKQDKIEMRGDRAEMSDFPLYLNTVAGGLDRRDQTIGGFSFVVKIYAVPVVEIIG